ncbi:MAG: hypothetical protein GVY04_02520 [Cyanobacteria bacterium]|nr:hypothetical protein [Cyanobacteria bacterium GSL.Bin1]
MATTLISSFLSYSNISIAESTRYSCVSKNGQFLTVAQISSQEKELVNWQQVESLLDGEDIAKACLEFTSRLQDFVNNGNQGFISVGTLNNQYFLCAANESGNCTGDNFGFLLMLNNNMAPEQALRQFFSSSSIEQNQGNSQKPVVNLNQQIATNQTEPLSDQGNQLPQDSTATQPKNSIQYFCLNEGGKQPVTVVDTKRGRIELIIWKSQFFANSGYTPQKRCDQVTARFQQHSDAETLRYISTGTMNQQNVICVAKNDAGDCRSDGLLITLEAQDNPNQVLRELFNLKERASSGGIFRNVGGEEMKEVIVWDDFLETRLNQQ